MVLSSIFLDRVRFATGKSLANDSIEKMEDKNDEIKQVRAELPFQEVNLTFKDVHYTVTSSIGNDKIELLKGIDGVIAARKMTALVRETKSREIIKSCFHSHHVIRINPLFLDGF
jgi:hypothetical protein